MAVIVEKKKTGRRYIYLGSGFGMDKDRQSNSILGSLGSFDIEEIDKLICVCDESGTLEWIESDELKVIEVNGENPANVLARYNA